VSDAQTQLNEGNNLPVTDQQELKGRSIFVIETVPVGVSVQTAFLTEDNKLLVMPGVFPNLTYALNQIDQLRANVVQHFEQAAQVGVQLIAEQSRKKAEKALSEGDEATITTSENS
jgi:hypothetical protein